VTNNSIYIRSDDVILEFINPLNKSRLPWNHVWCIVGLDKIEFLQNHENHEIYQKAFDIIEQYFGSEEEEDRNIAPSANEQQFNFAADMPDAVQSSGFQFWQPACLDATRQQ